MMLSLSRGSISNRLSQSEPLECSTFAAPHSRQFTTAAALLVIQVVKAEDTAFILLWDSRIWHPESIIHVSRLILDFFYFPGGQAIPNCHLIDSPIVKNESQAF